MNPKSFARGLGRWALLPMTFVVAASSSSEATTCKPEPASPACEIDLWAKAFPKTMPDSSSVTMWGFADTAEGTAASPGPVLDVPPDRTGLTINLYNQLSEATSIVIPGQPMTLSPSSTGGRVTSFATETAPGLTPGTYTWSNIRPGTYLYESGTHAAVQVQMGLYGALKQDAALGQAYAGQSYNGEQILVYSEVDPALHAAVADGTYGTPAGPTSTLNYKPVYFLVNGAAYNSVTPPPALPAAPATQTTLLRLLNAGLKTHSPALQNGSLTVVAEDGNAYPYARDQYSVLLPAGKTSDALWTPTTAGTYALYDRTLHLHTGKSADGMLVKLQVGGSTGPVAFADSAGGLEDQGGLTVPAPGVLGNDTTPSGTLTAIQVTNVNPANGSVALAADGSFVFTPAPNFNGPESFTYKANNGSTDSNVATVSLNVAPVNDPPSFTPGGPQTVNANAGAQTVVGWAAAISKGPANESTQTMLPFVVSVTSNPAIFSVLPAVAANGTLTYTPVNSIGSATTANVNVQAHDDGGILNGGVDLSPIQSLTITVNPAVAPAQHIFDLDRASSNPPAGPAWTAQVTLRVHNPSHVLVSGAVVTGTWTWSGGSASGSCTTNGSGVCTVTQVLPASNPPNATFAVTGVSGGTGGAYNPAANHDGDTGGQASNGTSITVLHP